MSIRLRPKNLEELNTLIDKLRLVGGVNSFERLSGRLVRIYAPPMADVTFRSAEEEAARHYFVSHPVLEHVLDMADFAGTRFYDDEQTEDTACAA